MSTVLPARPAPDRPPAGDPRPRLWTAAEFHRMRDFGIFGDARLFLVDGVLLEQNHGDPYSPNPRPYRFTLRQYYLLHDLGLFEDQRVMLMDGIVLQESPMNPPHATAIRKATRALEVVFASGFDVRVQLPLNLSATDPHPDLAVVTGSYLDYATHHPTTAALVVEVADTSLAYDCGEKASLYAAGGIDDYWVLDLNGRKLEIRRRPTPDSSQQHGFGYADVTVLDAAATVSPLAAPQTTIQVADLLP